jgi:hypothetical protein
VLPFIDVERLHIKRTGLLKHGSIEVYSASGSSYDISLLGEFHEPTESLIRQLWVLNVHHLLETMHREEALEKNRRRGLTNSTRILLPEERLTQVYTRDLLMKKVVWSLCGPCVCVCVCVYAFLFVFLFVCLCLFGVYFTLCGMLLFCGELVV